VPRDFRFDVFSRHGAKGKALVGELATRLQRDSVRAWLNERQIKPGDSIPVKFEEELEYPLMQVLCISANAFGSDRAQLKADPFRLRIPLNKERHFISLRIDNAQLKASITSTQHTAALPNERI